MSLGNRQTLNPQIKRMTVTLSDRGLQPEATAHDLPIKTDLVLTKIVIV